MKKKFTDEEYPLYEIVIDDSKNTGIRLISIVGDPAIEMKGVAFNADSSPKEYEFKAQADKQIIVGPVMIPNKKILRKRGDGSKYYTVFKQDTIEKMVQKFNSSGTNRRINVDHSNKMVDAYIMESWLVEDIYYDKSRIYGFDVPVGTWMVAIKVEDTNFWNDEVKDLGKYGFSVEGLMGERPYEYSQFDSIIDEMTYEDLIKLFEITKIDSIDSSNVNRVLYNDETFELVLRFNDGSYYTYSGVEFSTFVDIFEGNGVCRTEGSNKWGEWYVGKSPSVGAAVYEKLVEGGYSYVNGASFR